jgi:hypothetical protein
MLEFIYALTIMSLCVFALLLIIQKMSGISSDNTTNSMEKFIVNTKRISSLVFVAMLMFYLMVKNSGV